MGILLTTTTKLAATEDIFTKENFAVTTARNTEAATKLPPADEDIPFPAYLCYVKIDDKFVALFQSMTDIEIKREVEALSQGGENDFHRELPGEISYSHVTLKSGYSISTLFMDWMLAGKENARPIYKEVTITQGWPNKVRDGAIMGREWIFTKAYPVGWKISDFSLDDADKILIESVELSFQYFEVKAIPPEDPPHRFAI